MTTRIVHSVVFGIILAISWTSTVMAASDPGVLRVQFSAEPTQFDPLLLEDGTSLKIAANVIATPYEYDGSGNLKKSLVQNLRFAKDRKKFTIQFKKNLKWSDGEPFHANQFLTAIHRLVNEPVKAALSELFPEIDLSKTRVLDRNSVELVLKKPEHQLEIWLTLPPFAPIREDMKESYSKRNPVVPSLAAYRVIEYKREDFMILEKNGEYQDRDQVQIEKVKIRFLKDEGATLSLLRSGDLDLLNRVPVLQMDQIQKLAKISEFPVEAVTYVGLNTRKPPFNDVKNRRAFLFALQNKKDELAKILKTGERPAGTFLPSILIPSEMKGGVIPEKGFENPVEKLEFQVQTDSSSRNETMMEYIQSVLKDQFRWKMRIDNLDWKAHYSKLKVDPQEAYRFGWQNPISDPYVLYQVLHSKSVNNFTGWSNAEFDALVDELRQETKMVKKGKIIRKIEEILLREAPVIPLLHQVLRFANTKRVLGLRANPFGVILFRELHLAQN